MIFDFSNWILRYQEGSLRDAFHCFGYPGLHQLYHIPFFLSYKSFGLNPFSWYLLFAFLHGFTSFVSFLMMKELFSFLKLRPTKALALATSFLFLVNPYAVDVVVSKVTIHYFVSSILIYYSLYFFLRFIKNQGIKRFLSISILLFVVSLFAIELAYMLPILIMFVLCFSFFQKRINLKKAVKVVSYYIGSLAGFLIFHQMVVGKFIGHYGAEVHSKFVIADLVANYIKFVLRYTLFFNHWPYHYKMYLNGFIQNNYILILLFGVVIMILTIFYFKNNNMKKIVFLLLTFGISLLPVLNLYYTMLHSIESERYGYQASIFILGALVVLIYRIEKELLRKIILGFFMCLSFYFTIKNVNIYSNELSINQSLIDSFKWEKYQNIIILVHADNIQGARLYSYNESNSSLFSRNYLMHTGVDLRKKIEGIYQYNMIDENTSFDIQKLKNFTYKVEFKDWGSWFWKNHQGAMDISNKNYQTELLDKSFEITFHDLKPNTVIISQQGKQWVEIDKFDE